MDRREVDVRQHLSLHGKVGASGQAMVVDSLGKVSHLLNVLGRELWERVKDDNTNNLFELGVHIVVVVCISSPNLYANILLSLPLFFFFFMSQLNLSPLFLRSEHPRSYPTSRYDDSK